LAAFTERFEKIKAPSASALANLGIAERKFDIAFIDGSHRSADVYSDAVLTWPMMVHGGLVIFDDYRWTYKPGTLEHPKIGIDSFLRSFEGQYRVRYCEYQVAIEKL